MKSRTVAHSCPFAADWLITWKVSISSVVLQKMVNAFGDISHKASRKSLGFSFQDLSNFIPMPSFCCYCKKPINSLVQQTIQTHIRSTLLSSSYNTCKKPQITPPHHQISSPSPPENQTSNPLTLETTRLSDCICIPHLYFPFLPCSVHL